MDVTELLAGWRRLLEQEHAHSEVEFETEDEALSSAVRRILAAGGSGRAEVLEAYRSAPSDSELRSALAGVILPLHTRAARHPDEFRSHAEVRFTAEQLPLVPALGLPVAWDLVPTFSFDPRESRRSWFGWAPTVPFSQVGSWEAPARSDGTPLTHVVQVDLSHEQRNQGAGSLAATGLPGDGIIHLFHDLETLGWDAADDVTAWRVVWHPVLSDDDVDVVGVAEGHELPILPINAQVHASAPPVLDVSGLDDEQAERYLRAYDWLAAAAHAMNMHDSAPAPELTPWDVDYEPQQPVSQMGGFSHGEMTAERTALLEKVLPLAEDDAHFLLFDINPLDLSRACNGLPVDWFAGGRHLEVWIRQSDLTGRRFDDVRCIVRTDA